MNLITLQQKGKLFISVEVLCLIGKFRGEPGLGNKIMSAKSKSHLVDEVFCKKYFFYAVIEVIYFQMEELRKGQPGEEVLIELELKTIADVSIN